MVPALVVQIGGGFWWPSHPDPGDGPGAGGNS
jgi:hypothetical protein